MKLQLVIGQLRSDGAPVSDPAPSNSPRTCRVGDRRCLPSNLSLRIADRLLKSHVLIYVFPLLAGAAEIPEPVLPAGVGVNIHFVAGHERDLDLIADPGFKFVRMDFDWSAIEARKPEYPKKSDNTAMTGHGAAPQPAAFARETGRPCRATRSPVSHARVPAIVPTAATAEKFSRKASRRSDGVSPGRCQASAAWR